jgi:hypothetical protein
VRIRLDVGVVADTKDLTFDLAVLTEARNRVGRAEFRRILKDSFGAADPEELEELFEAAETSASEQQRNQTR